MILSEKLRERIVRIKELEKFTETERNSDLRNKIILRIEKEQPSLPRGRVLALALAEYLAEKDITVDDEELLAGHIQRTDFSQSQPLGPVVVNPNYVGMRFGYREEIEKYKTTKEATPEGGALLDIYAEGLANELYKRWGAGHVIPGYEFLLKNGFGGIAKLARDNAASDGNGATADSLIAVEGVQAYIRRYAALARDNAGKAAPEYRDSLLRIADTCEYLAEGVPTSFYEAIQLLWFGHEVLISESESGSLSLGRIDQILYPYYAADLAKGAVTQEEAEDLIDSFFIKLGHFREGYQNVTLGGMTPDGDSAYNDLSYMGVRSCRLLKQDQPLLVVRCNNMMPEDFWTEVQKLIECGMGFPALFNDDIAIKARLKSGIPERDARNYGIVGCVELSDPGREYSNTEALRINWAKVLEALLFNGVCPETGDIIKLSRDYSDVSFDTFEAFYEAFKNELVYLTEQGIRSNDLLDQNFSKFWPVPYMSAIEEGCLEKNIDVTAGGAIINNSTVNACGIATTINSIIALKQVVFEKKLASLDELKAALVNNFEGYETLRRQLINADKFGNGGHDTIDITRDLSKCFCDTVTAHKSVRGGIYTCGFYTVSDHAAMGSRTGATPDGRLKWTSLSTSFSPVQGSELNGPTEVLRAATCIDHTDFGNGMVLDMKFTPSFFLADGHREAFRNMIKAYFMMGGMEIQFNVIGRDTLLAAQANPKEYQNLIVRVSGFSAYFCTLNKGLQDEIINRTAFEKV